MATGVPLPVRGHSNARARISAATIQGFISYISRHTVIHFAGFNLQMFFFFETVQPNWIVSHNLG